MPSSRHTSPKVAPPLLLACSAAAFIVLHGCASGPPEAPQPAPAADGTRAGPALTTAGGPSADALRRSAVTQLTRPDRESIALGPPPGLSPADVAPVTTGPEAPENLPLDAVLDQFKGTLPGAEPPARSDPPSEEARRQALRQYASARSRLFRGDSGGAIVDLESATRLDPMAGAPWRELGEAQLQQGKRLSAMQSFREAIRRGSREPRLLWLLGRDELRAGRLKPAAQYLTAALGEAAPDPALPHLIAVDLADALDQLGYLRAKSSLLAGGLAIGEQVAQTLLRVELGELLRRRSELWREVGDALCRLGDYDHALEAYTQAGQLPTLDPSSLVPRQVYALTKLGRPAEAALILLDQIHSAQGRADERVLALIPYVGQSPSVARDLPGAIGELAAILRETVSPTVADRLVRAQAAAAPHAQARALLRAQIAASSLLAPGNAAALGQLLATFEPGDTPGALRELLAVVAQTPAHASACAAAFLNSPFSLDRALEDLPSEGGSDAQALLRPWLMASIGMQREAADLVSDRRWGQRYATAGTLAEAVLNAQIGRWDRAGAASARPALAGPAPDLARLRAKAAESMQRPREALDALRPLVDDPAVNDRHRLDDLIEAARLSVRVEDYSAAERLFRRAVEADPFDERGHDGLIRLYLPNAPLADAAKVNEAARGLRDSCPSSRALRLNAAEELAQRHPQQAEQMLLDLIEEDLSDSAAGSLLVSLWDQRPGGARPPRDADRPRLERAEAWLRERIAKRPEQPWLWIGLARVVTAQGRAQEGEALLDKRLQTRPFPAFAQMREALLRDHLDRADEADRLALARLEPTPRSLEASIELADLYVRLKRVADAGALLSGAIPAGITLTEPQGARLVLMLLRTAAAAEESPAAAIAALSLFDAAAAGGARLPSQLHETRLTILASQKDLDPRALLRASELAARQHAPLAPAFYTRVASILIQSDDKSRRVEALPYLRLAVQKSAAPPLPVMTELVRTTVLVGAADDLRLLVEQFDDPSRISEVLRELLGPDIKLPPETNKARAEFAYLLGNVMAAQERRELAGHAYRLALGLDPGHAWSKNNLGYELVETGGDLAEATRLLEDAYRALPEESSVIDSLAWLRYKQGILNDETGPDGAVIREGAVPLLERAAATEKGAKNATIQDHLGDALWAAGRRDEAAKAWSQASALAEAELLELRRTSRASLAAENAAKALQAILRKQKSLADGQEPEIAPRIR